MSNSGPIQLKVQVKNEVVLSKTDLARMISSQLSGEQVFELVTMIVHAKNDQELITNLRDEFSDELLRLDEKSEKMEQNFFLSHCRIEGDEIL